MAAKYANVSEVPLALAVFLATDSYDYNPDPFTISATTLLKPLRQIILPHRIPPGEALPNLADMMNSRRGAAIHDAIEKAWKENHRQAMTDLGYPARVIDRIRINPEIHDPAEQEYTVYLEQRIDRKLGKWTITGKFDFVGAGRVQDFKTTTVWTYKNQVNNEKYTQQGSLYRWIKPEWITEDEMDIHFIFTDWSKAKAKADEQYPPRSFLTQKFPLMSLEETEAFIRRTIALIEQHWDTPEELLPNCTDEDLWRSEPRFKYYKNPQKTLRSTKNFDTRQEAVLRYIEDGSVGLIKEVPGQVNACKYCPAFSICSQKNDLLNSGDLIL